MTLVVARKVGDRIAVVGDTHLTEPGGSGLPVTQGIAKSCMFNEKRLCVSFSNSPETAERDLASFARSNLTGVDATVKFFENSSESTGNEYLIAFVDPARIVKISGGKRRATLSKTAWIGDQNAFEAFREYEHKARRKMESKRAVNAVLFADEIGGSPASDLYSAMRHVVLDRSIPSVGGFVTCISDRSTLGFRYSVYSDMLFDWHDDDWALRYEQKVHLTATGENERFCVAQLSPAFCNFNAVAFYYPLSQSLFVFHQSDTQIASRSRTVRGVAPNGVIAALKALLGADLRWQALVTSSVFGARPVDVLEDGISMNFFTELNTMDR